ncbi:hypothetical protein ACFPC0_10580 [Streptomyces andamanensis]|uniref:Helix-turn-helix domain-containing protein n=1 Tax=Streptomyces andamanensis TaxID=1565035 RepID=A0ABV8TCA6_9ACTN
MDQDFRQDFTRKYWSHKELAAGLSLSRGHLYRLLEDGMILGPDIVIASNSFGWDPKRAKRFGVDCDRLDADGRPIGPPPEGSLAKAAMLAKTKYSVTPKVYVSSWLASFVYGLKENAVYFMRKRAAFIPADVLIAPRKFGWDETRVIEYGEQTGRLDEQGIDQWVVRRTEEFGLSPDVEWVRKRIARHPSLTTAVERAVEAWRASQGEPVSEPEGSE